MRPVLSTKRTRSASRFFFEFPSVLCFCLGARARGVRFRNFRMFCVLYSHVVHVCIFEFLCVSAFPFSAKPMKAVALFLPICFLVILFDGDHGRKIRVGYFGISLSSTRPPSHPPNTTHIARHSELVTLFLQVVPTLAKCRAKMVCVLTRAFILLI